MPLAGKQFNAARSKRLVKEHHQTTAALATRAMESAKRPPLRTLTVRKPDLKRPEQLLLRGELPRKRSAKGKGPPAWLPHSFPPPSVTALYFHAGGYSFGTPNPEYYLRAKGNEATGVATAGIEAFADPVQGYVFLAFASGNQWDNGGNLFSSAPMPEIANTVFPMDAISASASLFQVNDIAGLFSKKMKRRLTISATIQCPVGYTGGLFATYPGLVTSQL